MRLRRALAVIAALTLALFLGSPAISSPQAEPAAIKDKIIDPWHNDPWHK
ncbi:hypothetical protein [Micromonospora echinofusca]|uniref:Uncharacterized protein n=1 Tax=Micromonospora echinofusca TaxID=47858 RepID=A0ABS3VYK6_MICEH|nr:hypothetical protein [Micromonospora echinofusca]MBO4209619.1 hypothetical protein [Micromonospora echinofusca]